MNTEDPFSSTDLTESFIRRCFFVLPFLNVANHGPLVAEFHLFLKIHNSPLRFWDMRVLYFIT